MPGRIRATVRVYGELNDFLPTSRRGRDIACETDRTSVKDLVERLGVPHTEVDLLLVNGTSVAFDRIVRQNDRISVFPVFESLDIADVTRVRPEPLRNLRFTVDSHLGKLATLLRLLGFDALYERQWSDAALAALAAREKRVILTRDRSLLKRAAVERGYCVRSDSPEQQLMEVVRRFDLSQLARPFSRCSLCNGVLVAVAKEAIGDRLEPGTREQYDDFQRCSGCGQIYWEGAHHAALQSLLARALGPERLAGRAAEQDRESIGGGDSVRADAAARTRRR